MNKFLFYFIVFLRIIFPPFILVWPLFSVIVSFFLDIIDVEFAASGVTTLDEYEQYDKLMDLWMYIFSMIYAWIYLKPFAVFILILFIYRMLGQLIFFLIKERKILLFFPSFFDFVFLMIFFSSSIPGLHFLTAKNNFYIFLTAIFVVKILQEWWVHWIQISIPEKFFHKKRNWRK